MEAPAKKCPACGAANDVDARVCSACGAVFTKRPPGGLRGLFQQVARKLRPSDTATKKCPICGSGNDSGGRCCSSCGFRFRDQAEHYDAFVSYRRDGGSHIATLLKLLLERDYNKQVFLDVDELQVGRFDEKLLELIETTSSFILILTGRCLDRCTDKNDWLKREIVHAIATGRNIIPVLVDDFSFPGEDILRDLPESMRVLPNLQGVSYSHTHRESAVRKIAEYLREVAPFVALPEPTCRVVSPAAPASNTTTPTPSLPSPPPIARATQLASMLPPMPAQPANPQAAFWGSAEPRFGRARVVLVHPAAGEIAAPEPRFGAVRIVGTRPAPQ